MAGLPKHKVLKLLERAQGHLSRSQFGEAEKLLREIAASGHGAIPSQVVSYLGDAVLGQGREEEAFSLWEQQLQKSPNDPELNARVGMSLSRRGRFAEALPHLERAQGEKRKDPGTLIHYAYALAEAGHPDDAASAIGKALGLGAGAEGRLVLAMIRGRQGRYADAERLCEEVERSAAGEDVLDSARSMRADALLLRGEAGLALELWKAVRGRGRLDPAHLGHMAYCAQVAGEPSLADELIAERTGLGATAEDLLLFAQVSNLRSRPELALRQLQQADETVGSRHPGHGFEVEATRGRALRLLGRREEAKEILGRLAAAPEAQSARLGPKVHVDLGHLAAEEGDFELAATHFGAALKMDAGEPEAQRALELTLRRVAWREELAASADAKVEAARAEAEAMKRRFSQREGELEALRAELEKLKASQQEALSLAQRAEQEAKLAAARATDEARAEQKKKLREELLLREAEADEKGRANVEAALGEALSRCPKPVLDGFMVAERTFQKALYSDLPAAAVVVLYTGALERALYTFFVERFRIWLREKGRLSEFLKAAVREKRGTRVEYFDHFVEAFDEERPGRAPSMGEVGRVLERRNESYLRAFSEFLVATWRLPDPFFDELAAFVHWSKTELRDPVAHGRSDQVTYEKLRRFREQILGAFGTTGRGVLASLVG